MSKKNTKKSVGNNANTKKSATTDDVIDKNKYDPEPYYGIMDMFFGRNKQILVKHHIDSFNQFIDEVIPSILRGDHIIFEKISENKVIRYRFTFDNYGIKPPVMDNDEDPMFPHDAMQKKLSYSGFYTATVTQWQDIIDIDSGKKNTKMIGIAEKDVPLAKIPIMIGTKSCNLILRPDLSRKHCKYDTGGYFIVNGSEKVVLSVESIIDRKPMVFSRKDQNTFIYYIQVRSRPATQYVGNVQTFTIKIKKDNSIILDYKQFKEFSVFTLLRALGLETDEDIIRTILDVKKEKQMFNFINTVFNTQSGASSVQSMTKEMAIEHLMAKMNSTKYSDVSEEVKYQQKKTHLMKILSQYILPHVVSGTNDPQIDMLFKAHYICGMIHQLLECYLKPGKEAEENRGCDDRDASYNKRVETSGLMLGSLFDQSFKKMINACSGIFRTKNVDDKNPPNIVSHIKPNIIEQGLRQALSMGVFGSQSRKGLSQMFSRLNYLHSASYLRRIITPTVDAQTNKMTGPRHLHVTQFNKECPLETAEGPKTGLMKHLALLTGITISMIDQIPIISEMIKDYIITVESVPKNKLHIYYKVFLNGVPLGSTSDVIAIYDLLREKRFRGEIDKTVGLAMNYRKKEFRIYTEGGRLITPYLVVDSVKNTLNFKPSMLDEPLTWDEFMAKYPYVIEYLDDEESANMMLAMFPTDIVSARKIMNKAPVKSKDDLDRINRTNRYDGSVFNRYTHCQIHPCAMLGTIASNIPFTNHNAAVRGIYGYNQQKQAMGIYSSDYRERTDISYILYHSQVPIISSRASKYTNAQIFPAGENTIVLIASYGGYNQEDSIVMNDSAIGKGLFRAQVLKKYQEEIKKNPASSKTGIFTKPDRNKVDNMRVKEDGNYEKLTMDGYVKEETYIKDGDVIIGMINPKASAREDEKPYTDSSMIYKSVIPGAIDRVFTGFSGDGYPIIKLRVRSERIPIIGDKFACYDDQTEVLTNKGWIFFKDLTMAHKVATLEDGKKLVYEHPSEVMEYDYDGKMYLVDSNQVNLLVTPNHRMWVAPRSAQGESVKNYRFERADEILGLRRFYQKSVSEYEGNACEETNDEPFYYEEDVCEMANGYFIFPPIDKLPGLKMKMEHWLTLLGIFIAEGWVKDRWIVGIAAHKQRVKDALIPIIEKYDLACTHQITSDGMRNVWNINDKRLSKYLKPLSVGSINKFLPDWVWELDMGHARMLIHGLILGDGHYMKNGTRRYDTSSLLLANDFQRLCLHAGWSANRILRYKAGRKKIIAGRESTTNADAWRLTIVTAQNNPKVNKNKDKSDKMIDYKGKVYCCTVPSGLIYVRRDLKPIFSGNSNNGQKGTIGQKLHRADMPYTEDGLQPDLIINPNCIAKRMTIGQLIECLFSKLCAIKGVYGDGTPFMPVDIDKINEELVAHGMEEWGNQTMYCGMTGIKFATKMFIGPTYYQRLKQMVGDKVHSRSSIGPKQLLTRQPSEGRVRDGGLRLGEMERDVLGAHGMAQFLKERTVDNSDISSWHICDICGLIAHKIPKKKHYICKPCQNTTKISRIICPYAFILFLQELQSMNILPRIRTSKSIDIPRG